ncbi:mechanosensitive ion channel family protein (plasmid) [Ensifer adhaerens]|uniref:mechanosensitive ion channel family protein n=1 Tax=Ensifer adhaerens TaxID=106592 RepID=UPI0023A924F3|nr:mechanosensitive ion channel family protein [Ensifer adhaerens]WDZ79328.1 mechanosensitive ion channel family protein [Ensifer adhaerens]
MDQQTQLLPALVCMLGLAGIVVWHLQGRARPTARLVVQIAFFAAMTVVLAYSRMNPFRFDPTYLNDTQTLFVAAKTLWWVHLSWAVIGFVRLYLVLDGRPREARLIQDLVVAVVYLGVLLSILAFVFGVPIGGLLATSGIIAIILGLALQSTLSDVFSGIALTLGRPYVLGDWICLSDGTEGRVVSSNWRSTHLLTAAHNLVVLPNSVLAKVGLTNVSQPDENHQIVVSVRVAPTRMPRIIVEVMNTVLDSCNAIVRQPPPTVGVVGIDASAITVELQFRVTSPAQRGPARNEVIDLVYRHCRANGLQLAMPPESPLALDATRPDPRHFGAPAQDLIGAVPIFSNLSQEERDALALSATLRNFPAGAEIVAEGRALASLMIIKNGVVAMKSGENEIARLAPGDFFGEDGLLAGMKEKHGLHAATRLAVYELGQAAIAPLLFKRPEIAEDLAAHLAQREAIGARPELPANQRERRRLDLLHAIRSIFRSQRESAKS